MSRGTKSNDVESDQKTTVLKRQKLLGKRRKKNDVESDEKRWQKRRKNDDIESDKKTTTFKATTKVSNAEQTRLHPRIRHIRSPTPPSKPLTNHTPPVLNNLDYTLAYDTSEHRHLPPNLSLWVCSSGSHLLAAGDCGSVSGSRDATNSKRNAPAVSRRPLPLASGSHWNRP